MQANLLASYKPCINLTLLVPSLKSMEDSMIDAHQSFNSVRNMVVYYEDLIERKEVCLITTEILLIESFKPPLRCRDVNAFDVWLLSSFLCSLFQELIRVQEFLRVPPRQLKSKHVKIHTQPLADRVENWVELSKVLNGTEYRSFLVH
jgi:hypothetical protein